MNPHFALSAIFALGLRGIEKRLALTTGPIGSPGVTRASLAKLPTSLEAAVETFKREGSLAREVLGDYFVDHFAGTREHELEVHRRAVTNWEGEWALASARVRLAGLASGPSGASEMMLTSTVERYFELA
jgi:glutamine synthetase